MTEYELLTLIHGGENIRVEFKKSTNEITRDVYDTVCSFSNRDGGIIILGVKDNGEILGIIPDAVDRMKKRFCYLYQQRAENQSSPLFTAGNLPDRGAHTSGNSSAGQQPGMPSSRAYF